MGRSARRIHKRAHRIAARDVHPGSADASIAWQHPMMDLRLSRHRHGASGTREPVVGHPAVPLFLHSGSVQPGRPAPRCIDLPAGRLHYDKSLTHAMTDAGSPDTQTHALTYPHKGPFLI
jgi:hypothetical protein